VIDFVLPVMAAWLTGRASDALDRRRFRDSFARYLSRDVMARVLTDAPSLRGEHREVSILFSNLRGFTTMSEQMEPERIAAHLSEYFDAMTSSAPKLSPGGTHTWELSTREHAALRASFEIASAADATRVADALGVLTPASAGNYPPATLALMRAGLLFQETLYADARRELVQAIAASPAEATLHLLLGHVYDRTGLKQLASNEFDEAEALAAPRP